MGLGPVHTPSELSQRTDDCLDLVAGDLSEVHLGDEGSGNTSSALPVYWELPSGTLSFNSKGSSLCDRELMLPMQAPSARFMKEEDSQRLKDAKESLRVEKQVVTEVENESDEVQELMHRLIKLKGTG